MSERPSYGINRKRSAIVLAAAAVLIAVSVWNVLYRGTAARMADPGDPAQVAAGEQIYMAQCASCHGANLEGQGDWRYRKVDGRLPAPPHDESGHTWHHPDSQLFDVIKFGTAAIAPPGYVTDMGAFKDKLSDAEIWAVIAYIESRWPDEIRARQRMITEQAERQAGN